MKQNLAQLQREWWFVMIAGAVGLGVGYILLRDAWSSSERLRWAGLAGILVAYQLIHLRRNLAKNHPIGEAGPLYPTLGLGNWITLVRAVFLAMLAGFVFLPWPVGTAAWAPGMIYMTAAVLDFMDGWAARATGRASALGEILDMHWDGFGVLVASILLVQYGQAPWWYLLVGLARYLYVGGLWVRERRGLAIHPLPPAKSRRGIAGMQMGFIAVVLLPIFTPPATRFAASLFMTPLILGFIRDWLGVSGVIRPKPDHAAGARRDWALIKTGLPLGLRTLAVGLLGAVLVREFTAVDPRPLVMIAGGAALVLIALGVVGRAAGLGAVLLSGFVLRDTPGVWLFWALLCTGVGVMLSGTGNYSLWKPEEWLIYHRAGEAKPRS